MIAEKSDLLRAEMMCLAYQIAHNPMKSEIDKIGRHADFGMLVGLTRAAEILCLTTVATTGNGLLEALTDAM